MADSAPASMLLAASEIVGFAKTGGLADVAGALPVALAKKGHRTAAILPLYNSVRYGKNKIFPTDHTLAIRLGDRIIGAKLYRSFFADTDVPVFLVENQEFFERDDPTQGRTIYQYTNFGGDKVDYPDNALRYIFFCRAVMEAIPHIGFAPDILHANDWQTGLLPVYLRELYRHRPATARTRSLFTIHNIAYQGTFPPDVLPTAGLDWRLFNFQQLEYHGKLNFLKAGIAFADWVNTVSPTYAQEIQSPYFGRGLEGLLSERRHRLNGIVNGIDYAVWNPATDPHLAAPFDADHIQPGKAVCKAALQQELGLPELPDVPLLGVVARLVEQKGVDLVVKVIDPLMRQGAQLVVLGDGDALYHHLLMQKQAEYPTQMALRLHFDEVLAHRIEAGADIFLMPSLFEPSGLNQLYSLRYGTVPVVRATGGLIDTITDTHEPTLAAGTATGFRFQAYSAQALLEAIERALTLYREQPDVFLELRRNGMKQDWSWESSAAGYEELCQKLVGERDAAERAKPKPNWGTR